MKKLIITSIIGILIAAGTTIKAQNQPDGYLGLPGDNLNLYAVMNLFQESETLEDFERKLNDPDTRVNNLDLNGDNLVDYIMVNDYVDGDDHNIVLQVALNSNERQDIGVFTVERFRNGSVQIQLIGDEALYGRNYIIEPIYDDTPNPGYNGRSRGNTKYVTTTTYEIAAWPMIQFIYHPRYVRWHSTWHWGYYPTYWSPWRPFYYHHYYGYHHNFFPVYYSHYRHWHQPRYNRYNDYYYHRVRSHSPYVSSRIRDGHYRSTYSRPESRRDGEALYARNHANRGSRASNNGITSRSSRPATVNNQGRRTSVDNGVRRQPNSASTRNQNNARSSRSVNNNSTGTTVRQNPANNNGTRRNDASEVRSSGRSNTPAVNRSSSNRSSDQSGRTVSRSNNSSNKTTANTPTQQRTSRSEPVRSNRNATVSSNSGSQQRPVAANPGRSNQRGESARAPRQSKSSSAPQTRTSKSSSSSSSSSNSQSSGKSSSSEKKSEPRSERR